jgi:hypothetical protein
MEKAADLLCDAYIAFARTRNALHENPGLAASEGIAGVLLPGRAVMARAEGGMILLPAFSGSASCYSAAWTVDR